MIKYKLLAFLLLIISPTCFANFEFSVINASGGHHLSLAVSHVGHGNLYWNGFKFPKYGKIAIPELPGHTGFLFIVTHSGGLMEVKVTLSGDKPGQICNLHFKKYLFENRGSYSHDSPCIGFAFGADNTIDYVG